MSERTTSEAETNDGQDGKPFRFVPKTTVGKVLLGAYLLAFIAVGLSVTGIVFADPVLVGPMAAAAVWAYVWFTVMNVVLIGTYVYLFKPWAISAEQFVDDEEDEWAMIIQERQAPGDVLFDRGDE